MQITPEQERAMFDGAWVEAGRRGESLNSALVELQVSCRKCWFREHAGCEHAHCSIWRMMQAYQQAQRMRRAGKLDAWNWYAEAKNGGRMLFTNEGESQNSEIQAKG